VAVRLRSHGWAPERIPVACRRRPALAARRARDRDDRHYNAQTDPSTIVVDEERARMWLARGAQPTSTVRKLLRIRGIESSGG